MSIACVAKHDAVSDAKFRETYLLPRNYMI